MGSVTVLVNRSNMANDGLIKRNDPAKGVNVFIEFVYEFSLLLIGATKRRTA